MSVTFLPRRLSGGLGLPPPEVMREQAAKAAIQNQAAGMIFPTEEGKLALKGLLAEILQKSKMKVNDLLGVVRAGFGFRRADWPFSPFADYTAGQLVAVRDALSADLVSRRAELRDRIKEAQKQGIADFKWDREQSEYQPAFYKMTDKAELLRNADSFMSSRYEGFGSNGVLYNRLVEVFGPGATQTLLNNLLAGEAGKIASDAARQAWIEQNTPKRAVRTRESAEAAAAERRKAKTTDLYKRVTQPPKSGSSGGGKAFTYFQRQDSTPPGTQPEAQPGTQTPTPEKPADASATGQGNIVVDNNALPKDQQQQLEQRQPPEEKSNKGVAVIAVLALAGVGFWLWKRNQ